MAHSELPHHSYLRKLLDYDPSTGLLTWKPREAAMFEGGTRPAKTLMAIWNKRYAGKPALGCPMSNGYLHGSINDARVLAHRVIWKLVTGDDPIQVDHINGNRIDNRWCNLRSVTHAENGKNQKARQTESGVIGVTRCKHGRGAWRVSITANGQEIWLGRYQSLEEARRVRMQAERELGFHPNHGRHAHSDPAK